MTLFVLLVDDEQDVLEQLLDTLPGTLDGYSLVWDACGSFEDALTRLETRRYDIVVTDMAFRSKPGAPPDYKGLNTIKQIRGKRFCPIVAYSSRQKPEGLVESVFLRFADKARGVDDIISSLRTVLGSGVPGIARRLHDELDGIGGEYLWNFLAERWDDLKRTTNTGAESLERLFRRRAAVQLARLSGGTEIGDIGASEFYIHPKISGRELRLGEILRHKGSGEYRVVLTPHCYLTIQAGAAAPRADYVLTLRTVRAQDQIAKVIEKRKGNFDSEQLRRMIGMPPDIGNPKGRYFFLPRFLEMPDLYCDFMQVESIETRIILDEFAPFAVLDTPFAEALQARFGQFYASVGTANLRPEEFQHLLPAQR